MIASRKLKAVISSLLSLGILLSGCGTAVQESSATNENSTGKTVTLWYWDNSDNRKKMDAEFMKDSGYVLDQTVVESKDMTQKLQTTLASGGELPDLAFLEATYRGKLLSLNIWEDITKDPYNFNLDNMLDYLIPMETTEDGVYVGPEGPSIAGMAYKRELATQYFGTDAPTELEALFPDWDAFIEAGKQVQEESGGKVFLLSSLGIAANMLRGQITEPFVEGDKLTLDKSMKPILERLLELKRYGVADVLDFGSPEEGASYATDEHIFYPCATWSVEHTIKANDRDSEGRWGFMLPPGGPFPWGGTVKGVPVKAKNKEGAVAYIKYFFGSEKGATLERDVMGTFSCYKPVYEQPNFYTKPDPYFGGQDVLKDFSQKVLPAIGEVRLPNQYDQDINDSLNLVIKEINASDGTLSVDELIAKLREDLINKQPALE